MPAKMPGAPNGGAPADIQNQVPAGARSWATSMAVATAGRESGGTASGRSRARSNASKATQRLSTATKSRGCGTPPAKKPPQRMPMMAPLNPARPRRHSLRE